MTDPFADLMESLAQPADVSDAVETSLRVDPRREARKGVPEVVYGPGKSPEVVLQAAAQLLERAGRVLVSSPSPEARELLISRFANGFTVTGAYSLAVEDPARPVHTTGGRVGIITAGSSDVPRVEDAVLLARQMGCVTYEAYDVGVAGLHRLVGPLRGMLEVGVDAIVVGAGMDGALPSVVAGLVDVPVIGLPVSVGYGAGGRGVAALLTMLQSCSPGIAVVNIDNAVGAGAMAALIANRAAAARGGRS